MFVNCKACGDYHEPDDIQVEDVSEDYDGADLIVYVCPVKDMTVESRVYKLK